MVDSNRSLGVIAEGLGSALRTSSPVGSGPASETHRLVLSDGRSFAAQRRTGPAAGRRIAADAALRPRLLAAGVPVPSPAVIVTVARTPWLVAPWVEGESGREWLDDPERGRRLAVEMGTATSRMSSADATDIDLDRGWETVDQIDALAAAGLRRLRGRLADADARAVTRATETIRGDLAGATPIFAHGDLVPVNVIVAPDGELRAVLDLESACRSVPLLDVAWFGATLRFHHVAAWSRMWPVYLEAASVARDPATTALIEAIQKVRCLQLAARSREADRAHWLGRLRATLQWPAT